MINNQLQNFRFLVLIVLFFVELKITFNLRIWLNIQSMKYLNNNNISQYLMWGEKCNLLFNLSQYFF